MRKAQNRAAGAPLREDVFSGSWNSAVRMTEVRDTSRRALNALLALAGESRSGRLLIWKLCAEIKRDPLESMQAERRSELTRKGSQRE
jgi:hypothetical protein